MKVSRALWIIGWCVVALSFAVAMSVGSATASPRAAADQSYTDGNGDAGVGTDITNLTVRNDTAGLITFQIQSASPIVGNHAIAVFVDADRNPATGSSGSDYWFYYGPMVGSGFLVWNGSDFAEAKPASFWAGTVGSNLSEFRINKSDLGNGKGSGLDFVAISISLDPPVMNFWDVAPDSGSYGYTLSTPPPVTPTPQPTPTPAPATVKPVVGAPTTMGGAVAGKRMTVTFPVTRSDTGKPLNAGKMICDPSVGGRVISHAESFKSGKARLSFVVPRTAKGKQLKVKVTIKLGTQSTTKIATYRVK